MSAYYIGQIVIFPYNFAPRNWATCSGQILPIAQNTALFSILGTTYGGNGQTTFALPDMRGRVPIHFGQGAGLSQYVLGQQGGIENVTLLGSEIPTHSHGTFQALSTNGNLKTPAGNIPAAVQGTATNIYSPAAANTTMSPTTLAVAGSSFPHNNLEPYLTLEYCICLFGIFPARN
jgi:microcystin-dependent protein